ncbi:IS3 family transposase [Streptomyces sp. TG1A-8]|nr:IS3 family transposase [Streptomyces sp. TG1A-8]MDO0929597.1 IS3 family transposase [Streptomyces sp. TG1A-8]
MLKAVRSSSYARCEGEAARRARQAADDTLAHEITVPHIASRHTHGVPRIHAELRRPGRRVNRKRAAPVMRERDIRGVTRHGRRSLTRPDAKAKPAPDLTGRDFHAEAPRDQAGRRHHPPARRAGLIQSPGDHVSVQVKRVRAGRAGE